MASPSSQDWLELGLGFKSTKKQQQQQEDEKKLAYSSTTSHHLEAHNDDDEEEGLDLRLQIGPQKFDINMKDSVSKYFHFDGLSSAPNSGLWFSLRSSPNRKGGAALPQIPKAYIRVNEKREKAECFGLWILVKKLFRDEKMTVLMVKKYLVTKLCLSNEAEVELWCMGERLVQSQSLKEVRDGVWVPKLVEFVRSNNSSFSSTTSIFHQNQNQNQTPSSFSTTYLMCLYYGRTCLF